jgi:ACR3 family arsenite transporter
LSGGIILGRIAPPVSVALDNMSLYQVSIPIAICLFFMMYPSWSKLILRK